MTPDQEEKFGAVIHGALTCTAFKIKPFDTSKIGLPWDEI